MVNSKWELFPFLGVGPFMFGMTRATVRELAGDGRVGFSKGPFSQNETDAYPEIGTHFYYDDLAQLECIELVAPCDVHFHGIVLVGNSLSTVLNELAKKGLRHRVDDGYFVDESGFVLFAPDDTVKAVTAYRKGYY